MGTVVKEGKIEAKGYTPQGGVIQKSSKKLTLQLLDSGVLNFQDSGKTEYSLKLSPLVDISIDAKKKKFNINLDAENIISIDPDGDDPQSWVDAISRVTPPRYFGSEMWTWTDSPTEVPQLIDNALKSLEQHISTDGIFRISGSKNEIDTLKRLYDLGERPNLLHFDVHTITGLLKLYLRELPTPVIPFNLYTAFLNSVKVPGTDISALKPLISQLPQQNQIVLKVLATFLNKVGSLSSVNQMTFSNLAIVMGPNILRPQVEGFDTAQHSQSVIIVFTAIIEHANALFSGVGDPPSAKTPSAPTSLPPPFQPSSDSAPPTLVSPTNAPPQFGLPANPPQFGLPKGDHQTRLRPVSVAVPGSSPVKLPSLPSLGGLPATPKKRPVPTPGAGGIPPPTGPAPPQFNPLPGGPPPSRPAPLHAPPPQKDPSDAVGPSDQHSSDSIGITKSPSMSSLPKPVIRDKPVEAPAELDPAVEAAMAAEAAQWKVYENDEGRPYYHNETTGAVQWTKPDCLRKRGGKKHTKKPSSTSKEDVSGKQAAPTTTATMPAPDKIAKRKSDRPPAASVSSPMIPSPINTAPNTAPLPKSIPPPISDIPAFVPKPILSDSERIKALETKVAALENMLQEQAKLIEKLMSN